MRAAVLREVDGSFDVADLPDPVARDDQVVVRVRAAGINFADLLVRHGAYPQMPELPAVLGSEIAGELPDGTRVMALTSGGGGYAEQAAVDRALVVPLPDLASFAEGASFLLTFLTAYIPLTRQVRLQPEAVVLVYAAAGGVGTATIQIARALGARVIAAAGSPEKLETCRALGAEAAYVYDELPDDVQADVVFDPVGGDLFASSFARLRPLGTVVAIGSAGGAWGEIEPARLVGRNVGLAGFYLGRLLRLNPGLVHEALGELLDLWETGAFAPVVGAEFALDDVEDAHELVQSRRSIGKVVLLP